MAIESPLDEAPNLSRRRNCSVLLKREDLQPVFSFKLRGAYNKMKSLSAEQKKEGTDFTGNAVAILHVHHMVGGHLGALRDEKVFHFEFSERPGALLQLSKSWLSLWPHIGGYTGPGFGNGQI